MECPIKMIQVDYESCKRCYESNNEAEGKAMNIEEWDEAKNKKAKAKLPGIKIKPQESPFCKHTYEWIKREIKTE